MDVLNVSKCTNSVLDPNNNLESSMKSYSLRPRTSRKGEEEENIPSPLDQARWRPARTAKRKQKSMPLSKYRRKTANARERSRMREINDAFESLRKVIPQMAPSDSNSEKLTKITTLRLAMKYISALNNLLNDRELESDGDSLFSDYTLTTPDITEGSITSPSLMDQSSSSPDLFNPLPSMPSMMGATSTTFTTLPTGGPSFHVIPATPLEHHCSTSIDLPFSADTYEFEDDSFLVDFT